MKDKLKKSTTIKEIAEAAGVSIAAVSYILSGTRKLSSRTTSRIRKAADELGYIPNSLAKSLKTRSTPIIGIVVPDIRNPFFPAIMDGVSHFLAGKGYEIFVASSEESAEKQKRILSSFLQYRVSGIIIIPTGAEKKICDDFSDLEHRIPLVLIDRDIRSLECAKLLLDNRGGAKELTTHLLASGHKKIGIITPPSSLSIGRERLAGYREALRGHGLSQDKNYIFKGNLFEDSGARAVEYFFRLPQKIRPTAVLSCGDMMTIGFLNALRQKGLKVPRDISLVSFDDPDYFALLDPPMTCLSQPTEIFGRKAGEILTSCLESGENKSRILRIKGELKIRESVLSL